MFFQRVVLPILLLLYVQQSVSQLINRDEGVIFDYYGEKRLFLSNVTDKVVKNKSVTVQDKMDCIFECINVSWCRSVNFQTTSLKNGLHLCDLFSLDQLNATNSSYLMEEKGFLHYSLKVHLTTFRHNVMLTDFDFWLIQKIVIILRLLERSCLMRVQSGLDVNKSTIFQKMLFILESILKQSSVKTSLESGFYFTRFLRA